MWNKQTSWFPKANEDYEQRTEVERSLASMRKRVTGTILDMIAKNFYSVRTKIQLTRSEVEDWQLNLGNLEERRTDGEI